MKIRSGILLGLMAAAASGVRAQDFIDRLDERLMVSSSDHLFRLRVSGALDLEAYRIPQPAPGLIYADGRSVFNPRLTLFLDAQWGSHFYAFMQSRVDRGFDPSDESGQMRLDEFALRFTAARGRFNFQVGKFATVVGNWAPRHGTWENPFITAPLPYENLTGIWDIAAPRSGTQLMNWSHVRTNSIDAVESFEKPRRSPIIWGPSYATGATVFGEVGKFKYAFEMKNSALMSHPKMWNLDETYWEHPAFQGRVGYRPNAMWNIGFSAGQGSFLRPSALSTLAPGTKLEDYREELVAQDISFAWHHWQIWTEFFETRFVIPDVGVARTFAYYTEVKYKFTPQFFGAVRWNQQTFGDVLVAPGVMERWGRDTWRIDVAPTYRFTPHTQLKLQYSFQHEENNARQRTHVFAAQFVLRF